MPASETKAEEYKATKESPKPLLSIDQIAELLVRLSPEQRLKMKARMADVGLATDGTRLPGGAVRITVDLPFEVVEPLKTWAETAQEPFETFVARIAVEAITGYVFADFGAATAPAAAPVTTPTT